jgi:hypothetical protein
MNRRYARIALCTGALCLLAGSPLVHAQLMDSLKGKLGGGGDSSSLGGVLGGGGNGGSGGGGLGGMAGGLSGLAGGGSASSLASSSTGNVAGVLQFCIKNNYLSGDGAASVKDKIMGKISGQPKSDPGYLDGAKGMLDGGNGKKLDLSGGGLKAQVTKKACDQILGQAKSML